MRVLTWNSQGLKKPGIENRLNSRKPNIMVVQEAGNLGGIPSGNIDDACNKVHVLNIFNDTGYFTYWVPWVRTSPGGNVRCSLAIFSDSQLEMLRVQEIIDDPFCPPRPLFWAVYKTYWAIGNIHAGGKAYIANAFTHFCHAHPHRHKIIIGDYNQTPSDMKTISHPDALCYLTATKDATRPASNKVIDFAISSMAADNVCMPMPRYGASDHETVEIDFKES
ncbi:MAG: hypothetical protein ACOY7J_01580 [Pseudomonadota bacterium]